MKKIVIVTILFLLFPICAMGMEPGCGDLENNEDMYDDEPFEIDENGMPVIGASQREQCASEAYANGKRIESGDGWLLWGNLNVWWDCNQPTKYPMLYAARHDTWKGSVYFYVQKQTLRIYNNAFNINRSCNNCYTLNARASLEPDTYRPWVVNSVHTATHNGTTVRFNLKLPK